MNKIKNKQIIIMSLAVLGSAVIQAFSLTSFSVPAGIYPSGITGFSRLVSDILEDFAGIKLPFFYMYMAINIILAIVVYKHIGKLFTIFSVLQTTLVSLFSSFFPVRHILDDPLLIAIFGGLINGVVTTLCLRVNATTGGMDFISIYLSQKRGLDGFTIVLGFNAVVLLIAGYFFGWDKALYSIIYQYTTTQTLRLLYRNYQQETLFIVTDKWDEVRRAIYDTCQHGSTIWAAEGGYKEDWRNVVYSVVARSDVKRVTNVVRTIDPGAFINAIPTERITGRFYQEPKD